MILPIKERLFKRFQMVTNLMYQTQSQFAGLNPRFFRYICLKYLAYFKCVISKIEDYSLFQVLFRSSTLNQFYMYIYFNLTILITNLTTLTTNLTYIIQNVNTNLLQLIKLHANEEQNGGQDYFTNSLSHGLIKTAMIKNVAGSFSWRLVRTFHCFTFLNFILNAVVLFKDCILHVVFNKLYIVNCVLYMLGHIVIATKFIIHIVLLKQIFNFR